MLKEEPIFLVEYNQLWPRKFSAEKELVKKTLGSWIMGGIEHVGSTAVPGLIAKPVIDIMVGIQDLQSSKACIPILKNIGYVYSPYKPEIMHWFCKPSFEHREFHLYLIEYLSLEWKVRIAFRDYLRSHKQTAIEYLALKKDLAAKFKDDREAYTEGKTEFVNSVVKKILGD